MADINLTQAEADKLMAMEKCAAEEKDWLFPSPGERIAIPLTSLDKRENFMLDVTRAQIKLTKATYQNRARSAIILLRLDLDGPPHTNRTAWRSRAPICTSIVKGMEINGRRRLRQTDTRIPSTSIPRLRLLCGNATLPGGPEYRRVSSHDDTARNREAFGRLSRVAEGQDDLTRN